MPNGSLSLSMAFIEDSAVYGCTASNSAGFVREDVFLIVVTSLGEQTNTKIIIIVTSIFSTIYHGY